ncbi:MAG TPA: nicotinate-nucleotide adenylyltransferase [Gammaproteobacteria bacterium]|nr:nicotinate-nucleotide adenylyltransferase [Gammaproteobacteria bacterium]
MSADARPTGVFGGTFDPIHFGHLRPALELRESLGLDEVLFIPSAVPPHRDTPNLDAGTRLELLRLAVSGQAGFRVDDRELRRRGRSYTVDTLRSLRDELGAARPLCLLLGLDAFLGLPRWDRWRQLLDLAHVVVAHRPGWNAPSVGELGALMRERSVHDRRTLAERPAGWIYFQGVTSLDISATRIRSLLAAGRSVRYLLPDLVWERIQRDGLYATHAT